MITGCEATISKKFGNLKVMQSMALRPRVYPFEYHKQANEEALLGSYQTVISGTLVDMPFSFTFSKEAAPSAQLTVPVTANSSIGVLAKMASSLDMSANLALKSEVFSTNLTLNATKRFKKGTIEADAVYMPRSSFGIGSYVMRPIYGDGGTLNLCSVFSLGKMMASIVFHKAERTTTAFGVSRLIDVTTVSGTSLEITSDLDSEFRAGFQRGFLLSRLSVSCSSKGTLQSYYQRQLKEGTTLDISCYVDFKNSVNSLGIGVTINE